MNPSPPVLYSFRRCPYAIRARMALHTSGIQVELREVKLAAKPEALLQASPKATVPVLVLDDARVIDESLDIMYWALQQHDPERWLVTTPSQQKLTKQLIRENDLEFKSQLDHYKYADRYPQYSQQHYRELGLEFLQKLELCLNQNRYLVTGHATLVDYAILPFIRQFAHVDKSWFDQSAPARVHAWLNHLLESAQFLDVMAKYNVWLEGDVAVYFPQ